MSRYDRDRRYRREPDIDKHSDDEIGAGLREAERVR